MLLLVAYLLCTSSLEDASTTIISDSCLCHMVLKQVTCTVLLASVDSHLSIHLIEDVVLRVDTLLERYQLIVLRISLLLTKWIMGSFS